MKAKKFITKAYNGELGLTICQDWKSLLEKEFPELVKKEEVFKEDDWIIGKGYLCPRSARKILAVSKHTLSYSDHFEQTPNNGCCPKDARKASPEEIKERLIEECKKRGIWDTKAMNSVRGIRSENGVFAEEYYPHIDQLISKYGMVYEKGVFATPIRTITLSEAEKQLGVKIDVTK